MGTFQFFSVQSSRHVLKNNTCGVVTNLQPSIHCLIIQVKILFMALKFLGGLAPISIILSLSVHFILQLWSLSSMCTYPLVMTLPNILIHLSMYSPSLSFLRKHAWILLPGFSTNPLSLYIHTVCLTLYWIYYSILYLFTHPYFPTRQWTPADEGRAFNSLTSLHNLVLVKGCWKRNELMTYSCFVSPWFTSQWTLHGSSRKWSLITSLVLTWYDSFYDVISNSYSFYSCVS